MSSYMAFGEHLQRAWSSHQPHGLICNLTSHPMHVLVTSVGLNSHYLPWEFFLLSWAWKGHLMSHKVFFLLLSLISISI